MVIMRRDMGQSDSCSHDLNMMRLSNDIKVLTISPFVYSPISKTCSSIGQLGMQALLQTFYADYHIG
jgi:hypothetical protein